ncbi:MAG: glycosyltransferase [Paracoccaceae bacterium]
MSLGIVLIGRNEGARLRACLASVAGVEARVIYVDSGSSDDSVAAARAAGAQVVELDPQNPFTAARARNAGFEALRAGRLPAIVQFLDGDCTLVPGWLEAGQARLAEAPDLGLVTGWREEIHPEASIYNALAEVEWHRPAGPITVCGGDMMVRARAFEAAGGFDPTVIAAEDDEFCLRLAKTGWRLERLPLRMSRHDADMTRFAQWWRRAERSGHGFAQVGALHPEHFRAERRRVWFYGLILPLVTLAGLAGWVWTHPAHTAWAALPLLGVAAYAASFLRTARGQHQGGLPWPDALHHAAYLTLSKFPNLLGMLRYHLRRARGRAMRIIEYK